MSVIPIAPFPTTVLESEATQAFERLLQYLGSGRGGQPWCQWAIDSVRQNRFLVADGRSLDRRDLTVIVRKLASLFVDHCSQRGDSVRPSQDAPKSDGHLDSLTVLLHDSIDLESLDQITHALRPALLDKGVMAALLHPRSRLTPLSPGPAGRPYCTQEPFLTFRWAVPQDRLFVAINPDLSARLTRWLALNSQLRQP